MPYEDHPHLPDIPDDTVLWRYVDLYRLLDLIQTAEIHFTRVDQMEDRWEGSYGPQNVLQRPALYGDSWPAISKHYPDMYAWGRTHTYLNCWYMGPDESYAMWRLYDASGKGVAVKTTAARLKASLQGDVRVLAARVSYVDYNSTFIPESNLFLPYIHKRTSFAHESEYRLMADWSPKVLEVDEHNTTIRSEPDLPPAFRREAVNLADLIEAIHVSPDAPQWAARAVTDVVHKYVPDADVRHSDLGADPVV